MSNGNRVLPGNVISSTLINSILDRLDALESGGTGEPGDVVIFEPLPGAQMRVGAMINITGLNFGFSSSSTRVTFDQTPVSGYAEDSSDYLLRVMVPSIGNIGTGRAAVLSVSNGTSSATVGVSVLPPDLPLTGSIDIQDEDPEPNPTVAGSPADFPFILSPRGLNRTAEFTLTSTLFDQSWTKTILNSGHTPLPGNHVTLTPNQTTRVYVRITIPDGTDGTDGQSYGVALSAAAGQVTGSSSRVNAVVGQSPAPSDPNLTLTVGNVIPPGTFVNGEIRLTGGGFNNIPVNITDSTSGGPFRYDVALQLVPDASGGTAAGWTFGFLDPATTPPSQPNGTTAPGAQSVTFAVAAAANASVSGTLRLSVQRQGATLGKTLDFGLVRL